MRVFIYATEDGDEVDWAGPKLALNSDKAEIPAHPDGLKWRYFIATTSQDELLADQEFDVIAAFGDNDHFIF